MSPVKNLDAITMEEKENKYWKAYLVIKVMNMKTSGESCLTVYFGIWYLVTLWFRLKDTCISGVCWSKGCECFLRTKCGPRGWGSWCACLTRVRTWFNRKRQVVNCWVPRGCRSSKWQAGGECIVVKGASGVESLGSHENVFKEWAWNVAELRECDKAFSEQYQPIKNVLSFPILASFFLSSTLEGGGG